MTMAELVNSLIAGSLAGAIADMVTHPISTLKTRLQVQGAGAQSQAITRYTSIAHAARSVLATEGVATLYKGLGITVAAAAPAQGLYFLGYDLFRAWSPRDDALSNFAAGCFAQLCGSLVWVPMDTIKERLQIEGQLRNVKEPLGSSAGALSIIMRREGVRGLYPAYFVHQFTWMPFNGIYFAIYEAARAWTADNGLPAWPAGIVAGVVAGGVTNPMDVVKTRLQVVRAQPDLFQYRGVFDCAFSIVRTEGLKALLDGAGARILLLTPRLTMAIAMKHYIQARLAP